MIKDQPFDGQPYFLCRVEAAICDSTVDFNAVDWVVANNLYLETGQARRYMLLFVGIRTEPVVKLDTGFQPTGEPKLPIPLLLSL